MWLVPMALDSTLNTELLVWRLAGNPEMREHCGLHGWSVQREQSLAGLLSQSQMGLQRT